MKNKWLGMFVGGVGMVEEEICKCGHDNKDHSYIPEEINNVNLDCDVCDCENFEK